MKGAKLVAKKCISWKGTRLVANFLQSEFSYPGNLNPQVRLLIAVAAI